MPYTVLVVDDNYQFREEMKDLLYEYQVVTVPSAERAIDLLKEPHTVDVIVLDVRLPGRKGTDVVQEIKTIEPKIPVIILTGYGSKEVAIEALRGHADDFMEKSSDIISIKKLVGKVIDNKHAEQNQCGNVIERVKYFIEKNYQKRMCLSHAARFVSLTPKYLSRLFKERTGQSFINYKTHLKMDKAKDLLEKTHYNVNQIADQLGYLNTESFVRIFKKMTGRSPGEYRQAAMASGVSRDAAMRSAEQRKEPISWTDATM
ncbi:MAG TPA: response regulator transcription factor [Spirochaetia bacterium]|nr:response regulator transcription factor [Spirochaetia bacterium]